jgi:hypothetical protein
MLTRARKGMRVRCRSPFRTVRRGMTGTILEGAEKTIYCDVYRQMVFVRWDNRQKDSLFKWELEAVRE